MTDDEVLEWLWWALPMSEDDRASFRGREFLGASQSDARLQAVMAWARASKRYREERMDTAVDEVLERYLSTMNAPVS